jgi:polyisoprenoid-binding protein YceI
MGTLATPLTATTTWNINPVHSVAEFKVKHMMISNVKGTIYRRQGRPDLGRNCFNQPSDRGLDRRSFH